MIDQTRLQELVDDFGAEDFDDLIESFLEEAAESVMNLEAMVSDEACDERSAQFHFLKGCARNIGAVKFGDLCETWEFGRAPFGPSVTFICGIPSRSIGTVVQKSCPASMETFSSNVCGLQLNINFVQNHLWIHEHFYQ